MGGDDDGGRDCGTEDGEDSEYSAGGFYSVPYNGFGQRRPEEKEEKHSALVEHNGSVL